MASNDWLRSLESAIGIRLERERADTQRDQFAQQLFEGRADRAQRASLAQQQLANEAEDRKLRSREIDRAEKAQRAAEAMNILGMETRGEVRKPMAPLGATGVSVPELGINPTEQSNQFGVVPVGPEAQILNQARANVQVKAEERNMIRGELKKEALEWSKGDPALADMYEMADGDPIKVFRPEFQIGYRVFRAPEYKNLPIHQKIAVYAKHIEALNPRSNAGDASIMLAQLQQKKDMEANQGQVMYDQAQRTVLAANPGLTDPRKLANLVRRELGNYYDPKNIGAYANASRSLDRLMDNAVGRENILRELGINIDGQNPRPGNPQGGNPSPTNPKANPTTPPPPPKANSTPAPAPDPKGFDLRDIANRAERAKQMRARGIYNVNP
jgi:hypothetical protein